MKYFLYMLGQCTWGIGQTLVGFGFFIANIRCPHRFYRGCIVTEWKKQNSGLSLGMFLFTSKEEDGHEILVHEYGHTFQSLVLGPLYVLPGIVSVVWGNLPYYRRKRAEQHLPYTACFVERQASLIGEKITGEKALR